jgi:hypothetical protein
MDFSVLKAAGFSGRGRTAHRRVNDLIQLVNSQKSQFSNDEYINVAFWPLVLGEPGELVEHKFPIRGRIDAFVSGHCSMSERITELLALLDGPLSCLSGLQTQRAAGGLGRVAITVDALSLFSGKSL